MRRALLIALLAAALLPGCAGAASPSVSSLLPRGAHLVSQARIAGYRNAVAVAYVFKGPRIGVALPSGKRPRLLWSAGLATAARKVVSPGPTGVFVVIAAGTGGAKQVSVYRLHAGRVAWAMSDGKGRPITASSVTASGKTITISNPDTAHRGSVPYQYRTTYAWDRSSYGPGTTVHEPALGPAAYPVPNGVVHLRNGDIVLMKLETAWTLAQQEQGLMNRTDLDPDSGMVFIWPDMVDIPFWMKDTPIPLSIAFLSPDGTVLDTQDMEADSTDNHVPDPSRCASQLYGQCYQYAIEMNKGFFADNNIQIGDKVVLSLPCSTFKGFQSPYVKCYS